MATKGLLKSNIKQEILKTFLEGLKTNQLYLGLSLIDDPSSEYRNTLREYENNIWDSMTLLLRVDYSIPVMPVVPRNNWDKVNQDLTDIEFVTNEDDYNSIKLYRKISGNGPSNQKPKHSIGIQDYSDGYTWELLETYTLKDTKLYWTKQHCTISYETNTKIDSMEFIFYSVEYPENEIPVLTNTVSLILNPLDNSDNIINEDALWYSHRVNLNGTIKTGSFLVRQNPNITGLIKQYDTDGYGYIISPNNFNDINGGQLDFNGELYTISSFLRSKVKRMSGYTLFTQKFKEIYCNNRIKLVISIKE